MGDDLCFYELLLLALLWLYVVGYWRRKPPYSALS
jgi:hypothetical protein